MIAEIDEIVRTLFKDPDSYDCTDCVKKVFDYFGECINEENVDFIKFDNYLKDIFSEYESKIIEGHWIYVRLGSFSSMSIPYKALCDLFKREQEKRSTQDTNLK